jgi:hypothetical protein
MQTAGFHYGGMSARSTPASPLLYFLWQHVEGILATPCPFWIEDSSSTSSRWRLWLYFFLKNEG